MWFHCSSAPKEGADRPAQHINKHGGGRKVGHSGLRRAVKHLVKMPGSWPSGSFGQGRSAVRRLEAGSVDDLAHLQHMNGARSLEEVTSICRAALSLQYME
eukprot:1158504-Pelagomonas_calceolata.AAC.4